MACTRELLVTVMNDRCQEVHWRALVGQETTARLTAMNDSCSAISDGQAKALSWRERQQ